MKFKTLQEWTKEMAERNKGKIIMNIFGIIVLLLFIILIYFKFITINRILILLLIVLIISIYSFLFKFIKYLFLEIKGKKLEDVKKYEKRIIIVIRILMIIYKIMNPFLWLLLKLLKPSFYIWIKFDEKKWFNLKYYILNSIDKMIFEPILKLFYFIYKVRRRWINLNFVELIFKRIEGVIFSLLITTNIINFSINFMVTHIWILKNYYEWSIGYKIFFYCFILYIILFLLEFLPIKIKDFIIKEETEIYLSSNLENRRIYSLIGNLLYWLSDLLENISNIEKDRDYFFYHKDFYKIEKNNMIIYNIVRHNSFMGLRFAIYNPIWNLYDEMRRRLEDHSNYQYYYYKEYYDNNLDKGNNEIREYVYFLLKKELEMMKRTINLIWDLQSFFDYKEQIVKVKKEHIDTEYENVIKINIPLKFFWKYEEKKFTLKEKNKNKEIFYLNYREIMEIIYYYEYEMYENLKGFYRLDVNNRKIYKWNEELDKKIDKILEYKIEEWKKEWEVKNNKILY